MEKNKKSGRCTVDMKKEIRHVVNEAEGYTKEDHKRKQAEVKAAFGSKEQKKK